MNVGLGAVSFLVFLVMRLQLGRSRPVCRSVK